MKERVFYVINLDKQRIAVLSLFFTGLLFSFFFLGLSIGKGKGTDDRGLLEKGSLAGTEEPTGIAIATIPISAEESSKQETKTEIIDLTNKISEKKAEVAFKNQASPKAVSDGEYKKPSLPGQAKVFSRNPSSNVSSVLYTHQIASFEKREGAESLVSTLKKEKVNAFVMAKQSGFAVCIGKSLDKGKLEKQFKASALPNVWREKAFLTSYLKN